MKIIYTLVIILLISISYFMINKQEKYHISRGEELVNSTLSKTAKIIKIKYNLKPCGFGAAMPGGPIQGLTLCFDTNVPHTKEQLRSLVIKLANELLKQVNENDEIQNYLKEKPFNINNIQIIIYNRDKNGISLKDPEISNAQISQGHLTYSSIDPADTYKYKNQYEETYEEALKAISSQ